MLRARRQEDKEQRRRAFLDAVKSLFESGSFASVTMADVAKQAGLAKGTVFLYFPTKEALFLELLQEECNNWLDAMEAALSDPTRSLDAEETATLIADSMAQRPALTRVLTLVSGILEHNVEVERVVQFKIALFDRLTKLGARLEQHLDLPSGAGVHLFLRTHALVVGLRSMAEPGPVAQEAMRRSELSHLIIDFQRDLREMLLALIHAQRATPRTAGARQGEAQAQAS